MSQLNVNERYFIQQQVDKYLDDIIAAVREVVDNSKIYQEKTMGKSQFSQLSTLARDTESIEAIILWIEYQMGRAQPGRSWRKTDNQNTAFGGLLIAVLHDLKTWSQEVSQSEGLRHQAGKALMMEAIRQFLGQLERYAYARRELSK